MPENRRWSAAGSRLAPAGMTTGYGAACRAAWRLGCSCPGVASPGLDLDQVPTIKAAVPGLSHGRRTTAARRRGRSPVTGDDPSPAGAGRLWWFMVAGLPGARADALTAARVQHSGLNNVLFIAPLLYPDLWTAESALTDAAVAITRQVKRIPYGVSTNRRHSRVYSTTRYRYWRVQFCTRYKCSDAPILSTFTPNRDRI